MRIKKFNEAEDDFFGKFSNKEDLQLVKDLSINYLEDCESFDSFEVGLTKMPLQRMNMGGFIPGMMTLDIEFSDKCYQNRKDKTGVFRRITESEMLDYWQNILELVKALKSYGFESNIEKYDPNSTNLQITIHRINEN